MNRRRKIRGEVIGGEEIRGLGAKMEALLEVNDSFSLMDGQGKVMKCNIRSIKGMKHNGPIYHGSKIYSITIKNNNQKLTIKKNHRRTISTKVDTGVQNIAKIIFGCRFL